MNINIQNVCTNVIKIEEKKRFVIVKGIGGGASVSSIFLPDIGEELFCIMYLLLHSLPLGWGDILLQLLLGGCNSNTVPRHIMEDPNMFLSCSQHVLAKRVKLDRTYWTWKRRVNTESLQYFQNLTVLTANKPDEINNPCETWS